MPQHIYIIIPLLVHKCKNANSDTLHKCQNEYIKDHRIPQEYYTCYILV